VGTDLAHISATKGLRLGVFFGFPHEMSDWTKGVNFGLSLGLKGKVGVELLFLKEYVDQRAVPRCAPINYAPDALYAVNATVNHHVDNALDSVESLVESSGLHDSVREIAMPALREHVQNHVPSLAELTNKAGRFLLFPVNPACARGFAITVFIGAGVSATVGDFNFYSAFGYNKYVTLLDWEKGQGVGSHIEAALREEIQSYCGHDIMLCRQLMLESRAHAAQAWGDDRRSDSHSSMAHEHGHSAFGAVREVLHEIPASQQPRRGARPARPFIPVVVDEAE
jgi:hypothetical protein